MAAAKDSHPTKLIQNLKFLPNKKQFKWNSDVNILKEFWISELENGNQQSLTSSSTNGSTEVLKFERITVNFYTTTKTLQIQGADKARYEKKLMELFNENEDSAILKEGTNIEIDKEESISPIEFETQQSKITEIVQPEALGITQPEPIGHDDRYQEFQDFKTNIYDIIEKIQRRITEMSIEISEQCISLKDTECQHKNNMKELRIELNRKAEDTDIETDNKIASAISVLQKAQAKIWKEIHNIKTDLETLKETVRKIVEEEEDSDDESYESISEADEAEGNERNPETTIKDNSLGTLSSEIQTATETTASQIPFINRSHNRFSVLDETSEEDENIDRQCNIESHSKETSQETSEIKDTQSRGPAGILMLSDSIFRAIIQNRFAPNRYVNKQIIKGGCKEMLKHLHTMSSEAGVKFEYIILHTGTNDVGVMPTEQICAGIEEIIRQCQNLWPNSKIVLSGLTYNLKGHAQNDIIDVINSASERLCCSLTNVFYVDNRRVCLTNNGDINTNIFHDNVHLNNQVGIKKLVANLKSQIPGFRRADTRRSPRKRRAPRFRIPPINYSEREDTLSTRSQYCPPIHSEQMVQAQFNGEDTRFENQSHPQIQSAQATWPHYGQHNQGNIDYVRHNFLILVMLRCVVVENYVIFKGRHELDFDGKDGCHFYTLVGENASGKSSLVALIKAACNLQEEGPDFEVIINGKGESKVVCQFEFNNGRELVQVCEDCCATAGQIKKLSAGLSSWFCDELIKIPLSLLEPIKMACHDVNSNLDLLIGHRHQPIKTQHSRSAYDPDIDPLCNSQFLYIIMDDRIFVATKSGGVITTGFHDLLPGGVNPMDWIPQQSFLLNVIKLPYIAENLSRNSSTSSFDSILQSNYLDKVALASTKDVAMATKEESTDPSQVDGGIISMLQGGDAKNTSPSLERKETTSQLRSLKRLSSFGSLAWSNYHELKKVIVVDLLRSFPPENWLEIHPLFHEIIGSKSICFELNTHNLPQESFQIVDTKTGRVMRRIPEGLFTAFIIAALLVKPRSRNVILDEPTRGMHPLQTRRLRNILMRESVKRRKCIIAASHSPELIDVDRITLIWRFQLLPDGYCQIRRVAAKYTERELLFIGGAEVREIFFSRHIIWVEGESDKRFVEALLGLFDEGESDLWKVLTEHRARTLLSHEESTTHGSSRRSPSPRPFPHGYEAFISTLFQDPAYERQYFTEEQLSLVQEAVRSCKVVSIGGKKNLWKGAGICRDLRIPFAVICDLDAIVPNSRENSILSQFEKCAGNWNVAKIPNAKTKLVDEEESPASKAIDENDQDRIAKLKSLRYVGDVMRFYEKELYFFTWWLMGGEIEDAVRLTRAQFGKKLWPDMLSAELKELIVSLLDPRKLLLKDPKSKEAKKGANLEILRCIYFLIRFFTETLQFSQ